MEDLSGLDPDEQLRLLLLMAPRGHPDRPKLLQEFMRRKAEKITELGGSNERDARELP